MLSLFLSYVIFYCMIVSFLLMLVLFLSLFEGNKFISIHSFILERNIETIVEKPSPQVQHPIPNLNEASTFVAGVISDGDFLNPVVLSSSSPVPKVCVEVFV